MFYVFELFSGSMNIIEGSTFTMAQFKRGQSERQHDDMTTRRHDDTNGTLTAGQPQPQHAT